jgi:hypothetical protein
LFNLRKQNHGEGNLHDWWTAEDGKEFDRRAQCIADEYSGFEAAEGIKLNGKLTLGENTADNGGLRIALMAWRALSQRKIVDRIGTDLPRNKDSSLRMEKLGVRTRLPSTCAWWHSRILTRRRKPG